MNFIIRKTAPEDAKFIAQLSDQLGYKSTDEQTEKRLKKILNNNDNCVFVSFDENKMIGWIHGFYSMRVESDSFVEISGLVVDEKYRRMGIGKSLIEKVKGWAISKNINKLRVRCNIKRIETHKFYQGLGFAEIKEQKIFDKKIQ